MEVLALVGPAGTGKSHRALALAYSKKAEVIIDDGLLIKGSRVLAGRSSKSEKLVFTATRRALFLDPEHARQVKERLLLENPQRVLILGISENMVRRIAQNLDLPPPQEIIYIHDLASEKEIALARRMRMAEKKHVVPVASVEVKRNAIGQLIDSFTVFFRQRGSQVVGESSVVRPAYSTWGKMTISENVIRALALAAVRRVEEIKKASVHVKREKNGVELEIKVSVPYGIYMRPYLEEVQSAVFATVTELGGLDIRAVHVIAEDLYFPKSQIKFNGRPNLPEKEE